MDPHLGYLQYGLITTVIEDWVRTNPEEYETLTKYMNEKIVCLSTHNWPYVLELIAVQIYKLDKESLLSLFGKYLYDIKNVGLFPETRDRTGDWSVDDKYNPEGWTTLTSWIIQQYLEDQLKTNLLSDCNIFTHKLFSGDPNNKG